MKRLIIVIIYKKWCKKYINNVKKVCFSAESRWSLNFDGSNSTRNLYQPSLGTDRHFYFLLTLHSDWTVTFPSVCEPPRPPPFHPKAPLWGLTMEAQWHTHAGTRPPPIDTLLSALPVKFPLPLRKSNSNLIYMSTKSWMNNSICLQRFLHMHVYLYIRIR